MAKTIDFPITNRWSGEVQFVAKIEADESAPYGVKVGLAVKWAIKNKADLRCADLTSADLMSADLMSADLRSADLTSADLMSADLRYADLRYADLTSADLMSADLRSADLRDADLRDANLRSANLRSANLTSANLTSAKNVGDFIMTDGMKFSEYLRDVVPALLTAGGKTLEEIQASGCWDCHDWSNCPMHAAFGIDTPSKGPPLLRARIAEFVQFFDAGLIPAPWTPDTAEAA